MGMITPKVKLDLIEDFISECLCEYIDAQESLSKERIEESGEKLLVAQEVLEDVRKLYGVKNLIDQTNEAITLARQAFAQSWVLMLMCQEDHDLMAKIGRETEDMFGKTSRTRDEIFHVLEKVRSLLNAPLIWDKAFESKV